MDVLNPLSLSYLALIFCLYPIVVAGRTIVRHATGDPTSVTVVGPLVGIVVWLVLLHISARSLQSYDAGLVLSTLLVSLLGGILWFAQRRSPSIPPATPTVSYRSIVFGSVIAAAVIIPVAFWWSFHDELFFTGHMSIAAQMQNGIYPPRHLTFPGFELRYHYVFSLISANLTAMFRLSIPFAMDTVTVLCFGYTFFLLWLLGNRLLGKNRGYLTAFATLFAGGFPFFCTLQNDPFAYDLLGVCEIGGAILNPPMVSYFFQHPFTVGFPITTALLWLFLTRPDQPRPTWWLVNGILLAALAISQIVLFAAMVPVCCVVWSVRDGKFVLRDAKFAVATVVVVTVLATGMGGFFLPMPEGENVGGIRVRWGMGETWLDVLRWHAQAFFVLLPLGAWGLCRATALRLPLILLTLGSLVLINTVEYTHSWDIAKFATVAAFALGIGASVTISRVWDRLGGRFGGLTALVLLMGSTFASVLFVVVFTLNINGIPQTLFHKAPQSLSTDDAHIVSQLRTLVAPGEIVYRNVSATNGYAQWGGLAQPWTDYMVPRFGFSDERIAVRRWLLRELPTEPERWLDQRIRWFVLDTTKDLRLLEIANKWVASGKATETHHSGHLRVFALHPTPSS